MHPNPNCPCAYCTSQRQYGQVYSTHQAAYHFPTPPTRHFPHSQRVFSPQNPVFPPHSPQHPVKRSPSMSRPSAYSYPEAPSSFDVQRNHQRLPSASAQNSPRTYPPKLHAKSGQSASNSGCQPHYEAQRLPQVTLSSSYPPPQPLSPPLPHTQSHSSPKAHLFPPSSQSMTTTSYRKPPAKPGPRVRVGAYSQPHLSAPVQSPETAEDQPSTSRRLKDFIKRYVEPLVASAFKNNEQENSEVAPTPSHQQQNLENLEHPEPSSRRSRTLSESQGGVNFEVI